MAMNVKFLKGTSAKFETITKDPTTFYYLTDKFTLYLGEHLLSNEVTLDQFNALKDWKEGLATAVTKDNGDGDLIKVSVTTQNGAVTTVDVVDDALDTKFGGYKPLQTEVNDPTANGKSLEFIATISQDDKGVITATKKKVNLDDYSTTTVADGRYAANSYEEKVDAIENSGVMKSGITAAKVEEYDTVKATVDSFFANDESINTAYDTLKEIAEYLSGGNGEDAKDVVTRIAAIESDISSNREAWEKDENTTYTGDNTSIELNGTAFKVKEDYITGKFSAFETTHAAVLESNITAAKVNAYDTAVTTINSNKDTWDSAVQTVETGVTNGTIKVDGKEVTVAGLGSAAFTNTNAYDINGAANAALNNANAYTDGKIGQQKTTTTAATGVYATIQGATTNTVKDCVDAINALNQGKMEEKNDISAINNNVAEIVEVLTWGSF